MSTSMLRVREVSRRPTSAQTGYLHSWSQALLFFVSAITVQRRWLPELFPHSWFDSGWIHEPVRQSMDFEEFKFAFFFFFREMTCGGLSITVLLFGSTVDTRSYVSLWRYRFVFLLSVAVLHEFGGT